MAAIVDPDEDKENVLILGKDIREEGLTSAPPVETVVRTPLHDVNGQHACRMKRAQYSLVTPFSTPTPPTPRRKTAVIVPTVVTFNDGDAADEETATEGQEEAGVNLNSLVCRKVEEIIQERQKEFVAQLSEKDETIMKLERLLIQQKASGVQTSEVIAETIESETSGLAADEEGVQVISQDLASEEPVGNEFILSELTPSMPGTHHAAPSQEVTSSVSQGAYSPETPYTTLRHVPTQTLYMELLAGVSAGTNTPVPCMRDCVTEMTPTTFSSVATSTDMSEMTVHGVNAYDLYHQSPVSVTHTCNVGTLTDSCQSSSCSTSMSPPSLKHSGTCVSPAKMDTVSTSVTPVKSHDISTSYTPIRLFDSGTSMSPVTSVSVDVNTLPVSSVDAETMTTCAASVEMVSTAVCTTPPSSLSAGRTCREAPVEMVSVEAGTSPLQQSSVQTVMTPQRPTCDAATSTSPFFHAMPRPSEILKDDLCPREMSWQLETAAISNSLLRKEVDSLKRERQSMCLRLATTVTQLSGSEDRIRVVQEETKFGVEAQIDDLMKQQAENLSQIAELQQHLEESEKHHQAELVSLREDSANLQQDLYRGYKQRKEEIAELHAEYARKDYKPHFDQARRTIHELETQLNAYHGLQDVLQESEITQRELQQLQHDAYKFLQMSFENLQKEKQTWKLQHAGWEDRIKQNEFATEMAINEKEKLVANCVSMKEKWQAAQNALEELREVHRKAETKLDVKEEEIRKVKAQLASLHQEYDAVIPDQVQLKISLEESHTVESRLRNEKSQTEQVLVETQSQVENANQKLLQKDEELSRMKQELDQATKMHGEAVASKERMQTMVNKQNRVLMSLQNRKKELTDEVTALQAQIQKQHGVSKETQEFIEAEHKMVIDELRQSQKQLEGARGQLQNMAVTREQLDAANEKVASLLAQQSDLHAQLRVSHSHEKELSDQVKALEEEVSCTKSHAQSMLLSQGAEISESLQVVSELCNKLHIINANLDEKVKTWSNIGKHSKDSRRSDVRRRSQRRSFLATVLDATRTGSELQPTQEGGETNPEELSSENNKVDTNTNDFGSSEGSAFVRVEPSVSSSNRHNTEDAAEGAQHPSVRLNDSLGELERLATNVQNNIHQVEKCVSTAVTSLQSALKRKTDQLSVSQGRLAALQEDLEQQHSSQENMSHIELVALQQKYKRAEKELLSLNEALSERDENLKEMQKTLDSAFERLRSSSDSGDQDVGLIKENQLLKREVKQLQKSKLKYKSEADELVSTAKRRMMKFESNWRKAESEVAELDDSLDQVRQVLTSHQADVNNWPEYKQIHQLLSLHAAAASTSAKDSNTKSTRLPALPTESD